MHLYVRIEMKRIEIGDTSQLHVQDEKSLFSKPKLYIDKTVNNNMDKDFFLLSLLISKRYCDN